MAEVHGSKLVMKFSGTAITTAFMRDDVEYSDGDIDMFDNTNYGATADGHGVSPVKKGVPITVGGIFSTESHAELAPNIGVTDTLEIYPNGEGNGRPQLTGNATLINYRVQQGITKPSTWTGQLVPNDGLTWGTDS